MSATQEQALCLAIVLVCAIAITWIAEAPKVVSRLAWACVVAGLATLALCLTAGCSRPALRSPEVQIASWPALQAKPEPAHCSGFVVRSESGTRILTAAHCFQGSVVKIGDRVPIVTLARWTYTGSGVRWGVVVGLDTDQDVAVLEPEADALPELVPLEIADREPKPGEYVRAVSGRYWTEAGGYVIGSYVQEVEGDGPRERWAATLTIERGWSGSPVLDSHGRVLGLVTSCAEVLDAAAPGRVKCRPGFAAFVWVRR